MRPVAEVYIATTTPGHWPQWNPISLKVSGNLNYSLIEGESFTEYLKIGYWQGQVAWSVTQCEKNKLWQVRGISQGLESPCLTFRFKKLAQQTILEREIEYNVEGLLLNPLHALFIRHRLEESLNDSLKQLKFILEAPGAQAPGLSLPAFL